MYFTHRYEAGKKIEDMVKKKNLINTSFAFSFVKNRFQNASDNKDLDKGSKTPRKDLTPAKADTPEEKRDLLSSKRFAASNRVKGRL